MLRPVALILEMRLRQAWRSIKSVGGLWLIALPLALVFYLSLLASLSKQSPAVILSLAFVPLLLIHLHRRDLFFLEKQGFPLRLILFVEYATLSQLLIFPAAWFSGHYSAIPLALAGSLLASWLPQWKWRTGGGRVRALLFVPYQAFEWKSALRRYGWLFLAFYLPGLVFCTYTGAPLLSVILIASLLPSVFEDCEPKELMEPFFSHPGGIWQKLGIHGLALLLSLLPLLAAFLVFSTELWYLMLIAVVAAELYLAFAILYKYAHYRPGRRKVHNGLTAGLFALGLAIPFLAPACLAYLAILFRKAEKRVVSL